MESKKLVKGGLDVSDSLIQYLAKDAVGADFLNEYLESREAQSKANQEQQETLRRLVSSSAEMDKDTQDITRRAMENSKNLDMVYAAINSLNESVQKIETEYKKYVEQFQRLTEQTDEITKLIANIANISEQTNLLSFNASIEAAHAGAAGAGFRIIANEVKKLSAETKTASEEILGNVTNLQKSISELEGETKHNSSNLEALSTETLNAMQKFQNVKSMNEDNNANVEKISSHISSNVAGINQVITEMQRSEELNSENVKLFADCASRNQMLFNDLYSFAYEIKAIFEDLGKEGE
jgi:methyl-accepting chemotaxis protein